MEGGKRKNSVCVYPKLTEECLAKLSQKQSIHMIFVDHAVPGYSSQLYAPYN